MRSVRLFFLLVIYLPVALADSDLSQDNYNRDIVSGQGAVDYSKRLIGHDQLHQLIRERHTFNTLSDSPIISPGDIEEDLTMASENNTPTAPTDNNIDSTVDEVIPRENKAIVELVIPQQVIATPPVTTVTRPPRQHQAGYYIDPMLRADQPIDNRARYSQQTDASVIFGITLGTTFDVVLSNGASNTQPGLIAFRVLHDVPGYRQVLPADSLVFGRAHAVVGDQRLYIEIVRGITSSHEEFRLSGTIVGRDKKPGLIARVANDGKTLARAGEAARKQAAISTIDVLPGNLVADAGKEAAKTLVNEQATDAHAELGRPAYVVEASTQPAQVSVGETF